MARFIGKLLSDSTGGMMLRVLLVVLMLLFSPLASAQSRVVTLGGSVTEIVYALDQEQRLVANDASSLYPEDATRLPRVGYYRNLSLEGILSQQPDLLLASENAGPPEVMERLRSMGVRIVTVSDRPGIESLYERIAGVAKALGVSSAGDTLRSRIADSLNQADAIPSRPRRTLVVLHRGGPLMSAGDGTSADALLHLSGLANAAAGVKGYRPLSDEAMVSLAPDMIITTTLSAESAGGLQAFAARAGVAATPAAQEGRVIAVDDLLLLGMGPRVAEAVRLLREASN